MEEYGLVFSGGGGRGAYQIGVWKALERLGITPYITAVSGTSVGALNAAMYASVGLERAERLWRNIRQSDITNASQAVGRVIGTVIGLAMSDDKRGRAEEAGGIVNSGLFSRDGLIELIESNGVNTGVTMSRIPCFVCCYNSTTGSAEYFDLRAYPPDTVTKLLIASSAIPGAFPIERIGKYSYRDGGLADNTPVKPLYDIGYRRFIISYLDELRVNANAFPGSEFIELTPSDAIYLGEKSGLPLSDGILDFTAEGAAERIDLGESEATAYLALNRLYHRDFMSGIK